MLGERVGALRSAHAHPVRVRHFHPAGTMLALTPDTRRRVGTETLAAAARSAGFTHVGLVSGRFEPEARAVLDAAGLGCHELLGLQVTSDAEATLNECERLAADAVAVGARWVLTTFQVGLSDAVADAVARGAARIAEAGAGLAVEFSPLGPVATIADALDVLAVAGPGRAGLVIDSWNYCIRPPRWDDLETVPLEAIAYLQFADALSPLGPLDLEEAMTRRALPGQGVLPLERFAETFRRRGWDGIVSLQVLSDELRRLPVAEYVRLVHDAAVPYWS